MSTSPAAALTAGASRRLPIFSRQIVVFFFKTEGAGHAAAAGVDFAHFVTGGFEHRDRRRGADKSFLMAMAVQQNFFAAAL